MSTDQFWSTDRASKFVVVSPISNRVISKVGDSDIEGYTSGYGNQQQSSVAD